MTHIEFLDRGTGKQAKNSVLKVKVKFAPNAPMASAVKPISVLNAVQFQTLLMPINPFPGFFDFLLGAPGHIINNSSDHQTSPVCDEIDPMGHSHGFEKRNEEGVRVCSYRRGHIFFVQHVMK